MIMSNNEDTYELWTILFALIMLSNSHIFYLIFKNEIKYYINCILMALNSWKFFNINVKLIILWLTQV